MGNLGVFSVWSGKRLQAWFGAADRISGRQQQAVGCQPPPRSGVHPSTLRTRASDVHAATHQQRYETTAVTYTSVTVIVGSTRLTNVHLVLFIASVKYEDFVSYVLITILNVLHKSIYKVYTIKVLWHNWPINSVLWLGIRNET